MSDLHLADHLDQQLVQVLAALHELEQRLVAGAHRAPIQAVHFRIVEELLFHAPGFIEDLMPLLARIDQHPKTAEIERLGIELLVGIRDLHLPLGLGQQQLLAVRARGHVDQLRFELLFGAILEAVSVQFRVRIAGRAGRLRGRSRLPPGQIKQCTVGCDDQAVVIALGDGNRHEAIRQTGQIDARGLGRFLGLLGLIALFVLIAFPGLCPCPCLWRPSHLHRRSSAPAAICRPRPAPRHTVPCARAAPESTCPA